MKHFTLICALLSGGGCQLASTLNSGGWAVEIELPIDGGDACSEPLVEVFHPAGGIDDYWVPSVIDEHGLIREFRNDAGMVVRRTMLELQGRQWVERELHTRLDVVQQIGEDGTLCGLTWDHPSGAGTLRLEYPDGGTAAPTAGGCIGFRNGWWVTWHGGHVLRGRGNDVESLGNLDAGVIPGVLAPGTVPAVQDIRDDGEVILFVNFREPGGWLLPSRLELQPPDNAGPSAPVGFADATPVGSTQGQFIHLPYSWDREGRPHQLALGAYRDRISGVGIVRGHSSGRICTTLSISDDASRQVAFWKRDGGFVGPDVLRSFDAGFEPYDCAPVTDDWYLVSYPRPFPLGARLALLRFQVDCLP